VVILLPQRSNLRNDEPRPRLCRCSSMVKEVDYGARILLFEYTSIEYVRLHGR